MGLFKSTNSYRLYGVKLSNTRCWEILKECPKEIGVDRNLLFVFVVIVGVNPLINVSCWIV